MSMSMICNRTVRGGRCNRDRGHVGRCRGGPDVTGDADKARADAEAQRKDLVLDATCGGRMLWFEKDHPRVIYLDRRIEPPGLIDIRPNFSVVPTVAGDFTRLPFCSDTFSLVIYDPPHIIRKDASSIIGHKYGVLPREWEPIIRGGLEECWRVLAPAGTLIFKWTEAIAPIGKVLTITDLKPLFGHVTAKSGKTIWCTFHKFTEGPLYE